MKKRILSLLACLVLLMAVLPFVLPTAQAADIASTKRDGYTFTLVSATGSNYTEKMQGSVNLRIEVPTTVDGVRQFRYTVALNGIGSLGYPHPNGIFTKTIKEGSCTEAYSETFVLEHHFNPTVAPTTWAAFDATLTFRLERPAKSHSETAANCATTATCSTCGVSFNGPCNYQWKQANGRHWQECTVNSAHKTNEGACSGGTATCNTPATCQSCKKPYGNKNMANHDTALSYTNGICKNGCYEPAKQVDGRYEIKNAGQLYWFASLVNGGTKNANAVLLQNIDLGGGQWTTICSTDLYYETVSYADSGYTGTFDGNGYEIRNFVTKGTSGKKCSVGLFGTAKGATIKNLGVRGMTFQLNSASDVRSAAIVGQMLEGTLVENCFVVDSVLTPNSYIVGGIAACNYGGTIRNCFTYNVAVSGHARCGNLVSDTRGDISSTDRPGTVTDCWSDAKTVVGTQTGNKVSNATTASAELFRSGELAWLLNGESSDGIWKQSIGSANYPTFVGSTVYRLEGCGISFSNGTTPNPHEAFEDGFCVACGGYEEAKFVDGIYEIGNAGQMFWFAKQINAGGFGKFYAKLTKDIYFPSTTNHKWVPISVPEGSTDGGGDYSTFDGDGHTLHIGLQSSGLFARFNYSTVKNLVLRGDIQATEGYVGAVVASAYRTRIQKIVSYVNIHNENGATGGLVGYFGGQHNASQDLESTISDCAVYANISGTNAGGLVGEGWNGTQYYDIVNCVYVGSVSGNNAGAIVGYQRTDTNTCTFTNIYWCEQNGRDFYGKRDTTNQKYTNTEPVTEAQLASGEVAYLLGEAWGQRIGNVPRPAVGGDRVYAYQNCKGDTFYSNTDIGAIGHMFADNVCTVCGAKQIDMGITSVSLRPSVAGLYFTGSFQFDQSVTVSRYGIALSLTNQNPLADGSDETCLWSSGSTSVLLANIMAGDQDAIENAFNANRIIYARTYVLLEDGSYVYGDTVAVSLLWIVEALDTNYDILTDVQKQALDAMYATYQKSMEHWNIPNLKKK